MKTREQKAIIDVIKVSRRKSREEELAIHGKPINYQKVIPSKKVYNRKRNKAEDKILPYFFSEFNNNVKLLCSFVPLC